MIKCICGHGAYSVVNVDHYILSAEGINAQLSESHVEFGKCDQCGVIRQINPIFQDSVSDYKDFYANMYPPTSDKYTGKTWEHDINVAEQRIVVYMRNGIRLYEPTKLLDVGCGSGAFVRQCRLMDVEAYGCEIGTYHYSKHWANIFRQRFEDIHFPASMFDVITCHDVLEHVLDPALMLKEMHRILTTRGQLVIDYPDFFHESGSHHWKDNEHIWMFTEDQLKKLLSDCGFFVYGIKKPIPSKLVFYCTI